MKKDLSYWNEKWKPVYFEGIDDTERYEVSNYGRIRIFKPMLNEWKILKSQLFKGYYYFTFKSNLDRSQLKSKFATSKRKPRKTKTVHKLVAIAFCHRPSDEHKFVIHLDYIKTNNRATNLKWVTRKELTEHHRNNPNYKKISLETRISGSNKLSETDVIRLKKKLKRGKNRLYKIAKEFGITHTQLNRIRSGENWGHVKVD